VSARGPGSFRECGCITGKLTWKESSSALSACPMEAHGQARACPPIRTIDKSFSFTGSRNGPGHALMAGTRDPAPVRPFPGKMPLNPLASRFVYGTRSSSDAGRIPRAWKSDECARGKPLYQGLARFRAIYSAPTSDPRRLGALVCERHGSYRDASAPDDSRLLRVPRPLFEVQYPAPGRSASRRGGAELANLPTWVSIAIRGGWITVRGPC